MKFLSIALILLALANSACEPGSAAGATPGAGQPIIGGPSPTPAPTPVAQDTWRLILDGQGDTFAMGAVVSDNGVNIHPGLGPIVIPAGTQFEIDFVVPQGASFTILGVSRIAGPAVLNVLLLRNAAQAEFGFIPANGQSYSFQQY